LGNISLLFVLLQKLINAYILRKEYKKFGYTSINLRAFWFIALTLELAFIFLSAAEINHGIDKCKTNKIILGDFI